MPSTREASPRRPSVGAAEPPSSTGKDGVASGQTQGQGQGQNQQISRNVNLLLPIPPRRNSNSKTRNEIESELIKKYRIKKLDAESQVDSNLNPSRKALLLKTDPGKVEGDFLDKVRLQDHVGVRQMLNTFGTDILESDYGCGITRTSILDAGKNGDLDMVMILLRYGGKSMLDVKDIKNRDVAHYAAIHDWDMRRLRSASTVDCWGGGNTVASELRTKNNLEKLEAMGHVPGIIRRNSGSSTTTVTVSDSNSVPTSGNLESSARKELIDFSSDPNLSEINSRPTSSVPSTAVRSSAFGRDSPEPITILKKDDGTVVPASDSSESDIKSKFEIQTVSSKLNDEFTSYNGLEELLEENLSQIENDSAESVSISVNDEFSVSANSASTADSCSDLKELRKEANKLEKKTLV